jgi:hypothetical protein
LNEATLLVGVTPMKIFVIKATFFAGWSNHQTIV